MRCIAAVLVALVACGSDASPKAAPAVAGTDAGTTPSGPNVDTSDPPAPPPSDQLPCPKSPCTARPVIFIHGHTGGIPDGKTVLDAMKTPGERFDDWSAVGTLDHQAWTEKSIPRRNWGFNFDYYLEHAATDKQGTYTNGPGRVGSDDTFACSAGGDGHIRASAAAYDDGVQHEFAQDLKTMVDDVLKATGQTQVDFVVHSMGGLVARSYITYLGGASKVHTALYLSTPHLGVSFASGEASFNQYDQDWMTVHELAELDRNTFLAKTKFMSCGQTATDTWPKLLMADELKLAALPEYHCMRGDNDPIVDDASADHPKCVDFLHVADTGHGDLPYTKEAAAFAQRVVGGFVTVSTKL